MSSFLKGKQAEEQALRFFLDQGYRCLSQRFKTKWGEIDLIVSKAQEVHFVEVKRRSSFSGGVFSLLPKQQERIYHAALAFLASDPSFSPLTSFQFDLVVITARGELFYLPHIFTV